MRCLFVSMIALAAVVIATAVTVPAHANSPSEAAYFDRIGFRTDTPGVWEIPLTRASREVIEAATDSPKGRAPNEYPSHAEMLAELNAIEQASEGRAKIFQFGMSVEQRPLRGLIIAENATLHADRPSVLMVGNIHGDEVVPREMFMRLARHLAGDAEFLKTMDVAIIPSLNPDGFHAGTRRNAHGKDMNRCFPERCNHWHAACTEDQAPEIYALMRYAHSHEFQAVIGGHGGAFVVTTPWDDKCNDASFHVYSPHPDNELNKEVAHTFANELDLMRGHRLFHGGVINGAQWYQLTGGMQGWALEHVPGSVVALTLELSWRKTPDYSQIAPIWDEQRPAFLAMLNRLRQGLPIAVVDIATQQPLPTATVHVTSEDPGASLDSNGESTHVNTEGKCIRTLREGVNHLVVAAPGYHGARFAVTVLKDNLLPLKTVELTPL